ncbi:GntR family transcriptional regulator (plasmid) [Rhodococcus opacus]|uniref:GntR family transcriptional regulator n=1 Tax=Rhodococcus opacus TaxID=37919 RepID=A0A1B1KI03_RHOOP|nr:GntR family transcriptional regulator [Rhodococcus opacus]ANS32224.1 GntR family transcriptional regulator [Rhodococcus opacus]
MATPETSTVHTAADVHSLLLSVPGDSSAGKAPRRVMSRHVADRIRQLIFDGTLKRGQRIPQDALAEELGVSRLPIREALITLESEGLVTSEAHRGAFVVPIRQEDIEDHYRIFGLIQGLAARRAATRMNAPTVERLRELHEQMRTTTDREEFHDLNWAFHSLINQTGGSRRLQSILRQLGHNLPRAVYENPSGSIDEANSGHARIIAALEAGNGPEADVASQEHTVAEGDYVIAKLKKEGILEV